ncbi:MAG: DMT family transporter [Acidimicrobiia bacterium]
MNPALVLTIALVGGIAIALQAQFAGVLDGRLGTFDAVTVSFLSAGAAIGIARLAAGGIDFAVWRRAPWWAYLVGILGLVIVGTIGFAAPRIGLVPTLAAVTAAQFAASSTIAHFGMFEGTADPIDLETVIGLALLCVGGWLVIR